MTARSPRPENIANRVKATERAGYVARRICAKGSIEVAKPAELVDHAGLSIVNISET